MARYIDADALIERLKFKRDETDISGKKYSGLECAIAQVQKQPAADVVPRVELDAMRGAANSYKMHYENLAREIFEEIGKLHLHLASQHDAIKFAELKKKYTEGQDNQ